MTVLEIWANAISY